MFATEKSPRIGFIGLGNVGNAAAPNLISSGFEVHGYDINPCPEFTAAGGIIMSDVTEIAKCDVILQSLPHAQAINAVLSKLQPLMSDRHTFIDLSSYALEEKKNNARWLADRGVKMLDCEISGLPFQILKKDAVIFKSGDRECVEAHTSVFDALADKHFYLGDFGTATNMKLIANTMVCVHNTMAAEALSLGEAAGIDPQLMIDVLGPSAAGSATFSNKAPLMLKGGFENGIGPFRHMFGYLQRTRDLALSVGRENAIPLLEASKAIFDVAETQGRHDQDIAAVIEVLNDMQKEAGHDARE